MEYSNKLSHMPTYDSLKHNFSWDMSDKMSFIANISTVSLCTLGLFIKGQLHYNLVQPSD
jgi:hypothetical protein